MTVVHSHVQQSAATTSFHRCNTEQQHLILANTSSVAALTLSRQFPERQCLCLAASGLYWTDQAKSKLIRVLTEAGLPCSDLFLLTVPVTSTYGIYGSATAHTWPSSNNTEQGLPGLKCSLQLCYISKVLYHLQSVLGIPIRTYRYFSDVQIIKGT